VDVFSGVSLFVSLLVTGSIAYSAKRRYLSYSEADFEIFRPAGTTRCTDGVKFGTSSVPNFTPISATIRVYDPQNKTEFCTEI